MLRRYLRSVVVLGGLAAMMLSTGCAVREYRYHDRYRDHHRHHDRWDRDHHRDHRDDRDGRWDRR